MYPIQTVKYLLAGKNGGYRTCRQLGGNVLCQTETALRLSSCCWSLASSVYEQWEAFNKRDVGKATKQLADDYTEFNPAVATRLDGKDLNVRLAEAGNQDSGEGILAEMLNPKVQVYGDVAILSYNYLGMTKDKDGNTETTRAKSTRVYVKQGGDWKLVHANFGADPNPN